MNDMHDDSLDQLFAGDTGSVRIEPVRAAPAYKPAEVRFEEGCPKCRGTGRFVSYSGRVLGECFTCKGKGKKVFKTSADDRAANREKTAMRKAETSANDLDAFKAGSPAEWQWIDTASKGGNEFAISLIAGIIKYGDLTDKQRAAVQNAIARDASRVQAVVNAPAVAVEGIDRLKASFDQAIAYSAAKGLKLSPRITIDGMTISPAKANSANPGALYVKAGQVYLGKVANGRFYASRDCDDAAQTKVLAFVADPAEAAKVYGQTTGTCCICNATLRSEWKLRGIGPVCATKFGW
jgi:hypothetical protein